MRIFDTILYLDDMRVPKMFGIDVAVNYDEFVAYIKGHGVPDLISFDHDLSDAHCPKTEEEMSEQYQLDYDRYTEKTGYHCARYIVDNGLNLRSWCCHSMNPAGKRNIEQLLRSYYPEGEFHGRRIPYHLRQQAA